MTITAIIILTLAIVYIAYCVLLFGWSLRTTMGVAYYGKPLAERRKFKSKIARYRKSMFPFFKLISKIFMPKSGRAMARGAIHYNNVCLPGLILSRNSISKACRYQPQVGDIFIATQQRSGTTWTQQMVYEILSRGKGDLSDQGHVHLYALSPRIEAKFGVPIENAPPIGEQKRRIIKTHLPSELCPYSDEARYIYIARHPVSCCASVVDWWNHLMGPLCPRKDVCKRQRVHE